MESKYLRIAVLGDAGVGKKTMIRRMITGEFSNELMNDNILRYNSNYGNITFEFFNEYNIGDPVENVDGAIVMFDVTNTATYLNIMNWVHEVRDKLPFVICGNKVDAIGRSVKPKHITMPKKIGIVYFDTSYKSNYNFEKPLLVLARALIPKPPLVFTSN